MATARVAVAAMASLCLRVPQAAIPQQELEFDIPAGFLSSALIEIGRCSGVIVSFRPELVGTQSVSQIRGRFLPQEALAQALLGTGLSVDVKPDGAVTVVPAPAPPLAHSPDPAAPDGDTLSAVQVQAAADAPADIGLLAPSATTATRTDTVLSRLPQAVSVVTRDAMDLQGARTSTDALLYVPGVTGQIYDVSLGMMPTLEVRGFPALLLMSGMRTIRDELPLDSETLERIEVLKGPNGVIGTTAGLGGPGGTINLIRKRAEPNHRNTVTMGMSSGDNGTLRSSFDLGATLAPETDWRLVGYGSRSGHTDGGYDGQNSRGLLGVLGHRGRDLQVTLTVQGDRRRDVPAAASRLLMSADTDFAVGIGSEVSAISSEDRTLSNAGDIELDVAWRFLPKWRTTLKVRRETVRRDVSRHVYWEGSYPTVILGLQRTTSRLSGLQAGVIGDVTTGPVNHQLMLAADVERSRSVWSDGYAVWYVDSATFVPGQTMLSDTPDNGDRFAQQPSSASRALQRGLLLQDQLSWGNVSARLAVQQSRMSERQVSFGMEGEGDTEQSYKWPKAFNWDVGLAYQLAPFAAVYGGWQSILAWDYQAADPEPLSDGSVAPAPRMRQVQAGVKFDLLDDRLALTVEAFRLQQLNLVANSADLGGYFMYRGGDVRGLEIEMKGRVAPALEMSLGLTAVRARTSYPDGQTTQVATVTEPGVPARSLNLLARYHLPETVMPASSVGLALRAFSSMWSVPPGAGEGVPPLRLPGGARTDLSWTRKTGSWTFGLSVQNLFDRKLYGTYSSQGYIPLQPGRSLGVVVGFRE